MLRQALVAGCIAGAAAFAPAALPQAATRKAGVSGMCPSLHVHPICAGHGCGVAALGGRTTSGGFLKIQQWHCDGSQEWDALLELLSRVMVGLSSQQVVGADASTRDFEHSLLRCAEALGAWFTLQAPWEHVLTQWRVGDSAKQYVGTVSSDLSGFPWPLHGSFSVSGQLTTVVHSSCS
jgi:hypothetical protein